MKVVDLLRGNTTLNFHVIELPLEISFVMRKEFCGALPPSCECQCDEDSSLDFKKEKLSHYRLGQTLRAPGGSRLPRFVYSRHIKVVRFSALHPGRLYSPEYMFDIRFCWRLSRASSHSAIGRIK